MCVTACKQDSFDHHMKITITVKSCLRCNENMSVELRAHSTFVCLGGKVKVPIGETHQPMSTSVRCYSSLVAGSSTFSALDHDQASSGLLTPSVVLECDILEI